MYLKNLAKLSFAALAMGIFIPNAYATDISDALKNTLNSENFSYKSVTDIKMEKSPLLDSPFAIDLKIFEEGGKNQNNYAEKGELKIKISDLTDLPFSVSALSNINILLTYRDHFLDAKKIGYALFDKVEISSNINKIQKFTESMNQMAKFMTGKYFKFSMKELGDLFSEQLSGSLDAEDLMVFNAFTGKSMAEMSLSMGKLIEGLIDSGLLVDDILDNGSRRTLSEIHVISLGKSIDAKGAELLRKTLTDFLVDMFPLLAADIKNELQADTATQMAKDINEALAFMEAADLNFQLGVYNGLIQNISGHIDLDKVGLPVTGDMTMDFDYSNSFNLPFPQDESLIIDFNKIIDGFMSMSNFAGSSNFSQSEWDNSEAATNYYLVLDTLDEIDNFLWNVCGDDRACRKTEINILRRDLRQLKKDGVVDQQEFAKRSRELNTLR